MNELEAAIKRISDKAIPLTLNCEVKRSAEIQRRTTLRFEILELIRQQQTPKPYCPNLEYKDGSWSYDTNGLGTPANQVPDV